MAQSSEVNAGDDILAIQYNNLRDDVLNPNTGHNHSGEADGGAIVGSPLFPKVADMVGDGSDGDLVLSSLLELAEPKQYNDLTIDSGGEIRPVSNAQIIVIHVAGTLRINSGGKIHADEFGALGGVQGDGAEGFVSEDDGLASAPTQATDGGDGRRSFHQLKARINAGEDVFFAFGSGGGGAINAGGARSGGSKWAGGGRSESPAFSSGGNGGKGGGCVMIFADTIILNSGGEITARGEDSGSQGGGGSASGGGGGGGLVYLAFKTFNTNDGLLSAVGGIGSPGSTLIGGDGADGLVVEKRIPA